MATAPSGIPYITRPSDGWMNDMGEKLSKWPAIKRRFVAQKAMVERTVNVMRTVQGSDVLNTGDAGLDVYADALAWYNEDDQVANDIKAWDDDFAEAVREAIRRGNISPAEAASIGYGGLGELTLLGALLIFAVVAAVAWISSKFGQAWVEAKEEAKVRIEQAVLAHERQAIKIKTAGEAWAAAYARDHSIPYPNIPDEPGPYTPGPVGKAAASAIGLGAVAAIAAGLYVLTRKGARRK